jgi:anti-anti-sigma regulatory factor
LRISEHRARESGKTMRLVGLNPGVLEQIRASGLAECMGKERMLFNVQTAIAHFQTLEPPQG